MWAFGRIGLDQAILNGPAADLGAVELEGVQAQGLGGGEAVRARRGADQAFFEQVGDQLGPRDGVVATRDSRYPQMGFLWCAGPQVNGGERIEGTAGHIELLGSFGGRQGMLPEGSQQMPDEGRRVAIR